MALINVSDYFGRLSRQEKISDNEIRDLLEAYEQQLALANYLACCHAATAEYLPASTSRSERERMRSILEIAADGLQGFNKMYSFQGTAITREQCLEVAKELSAQTANADAAKLARKQQRKIGINKNSA